MTGEDFLKCFDESDTVLIINAPLNKSHIKFQVSHSFLKFNINKIKLYFMYLAEFLNLL